MVIIFGLLPIIASFRVGRFPLIIALLLIGAICTGVLIADRTFENRRLLNIRGLTRKGLRPILINFAVGGTLICLFTLIFRREDLFGFVRERPDIWAMVMLLYPLLSAYPQEIVYRPFFFHRYQGLFRNRMTLWVTNAALFGYAHILFGNAVAVVMSGVGGFLFARTYDRTKSTFAVTLEHALYGCLIFTIGLGRLFYTGGAR